ncbi:MAG: SOUL family heme-binding protein [Actinomycetes bacterium]
MTEQQVYEIIARYPNAELRKYSRCTLAEVTLTGSAERVGNRAFGPLVRYISAQQLAMTAPVLQAEAQAQSQWTVSFVLPGSKASSEYPLPGDANVTLRELPEHLAMAMTWSGRWTYSSVEKHTEALRLEIKNAGLLESGTPVWARYDPPWKPWFLRRNEVLIPVQSM